MLEIITHPTALQAKRHADGSLTVAVTPHQRQGYMSTADYFSADMNGLIEIIMTEPLRSGHVAITYYVN